MAIKFGFVRYGRNDDVADRRVACDCDAPRVKPDPPNSQAKCRGCGEYCDSAFMFPTLRIWVIR